MMDGFTAEVEKLAPEKNIVGTYNRAEVMVKSICLHNDRI